MSTLKHLPVADLKAKYGLVNFVETGTCAGDGLRFALSCGFERYFSCDIVQKFADQVAEEFRADLRVTIVNADSLRFLEALPRDIGPSFFWLDAHQPKLYDPRIVEEGSSRFPLPDEIKTIKARPGYERDVIMADDLIVIEGSPRWHAGEVCEELLVRSFTFEELCALLADTHDVGVDLDMEGTVTFTPKAGS